MKNREKRTTLAEFRLIRAFSVDHNARRFRRYVERLKRKPDMQRWRCRMRLRRRFSTRRHQPTTKRAA